MTSEGLEASEVAGRTDLWYNTGKEEVTMKFTLPMTIKCFDDEGRRQTVSETTETQLKRRRM